MSTKRPSPRVALWCSGSASSLDPIADAKFRVLQAESAVESARKNLTGAEVDLKVARIVLESLLPNVISQTRRGEAPELSVVIWIGSVFISSSPTTRPILASGALLSLLAGH